MKKINKAKIKINGKKCIINPKMTLKEVIARFKIPLDKVAIELNENIITHLIVIYYENYKKNKN